MIYLTNGNTSLNAAYADKISQEANSTYQLTFRFPTSDALWEKLKEETFLKADDLHGEQDFVIFEVQKKHGYIQVYANQSFTLLNNYVINPISLDRATGSTALSRFAGSITRDNPFSFFSDIDERHTFNTDSVNAMTAFTKDKHSILGQWGGDLVRHGYQVRLLKNGGSENESLFMYKKNLSSYQQKTSTKSLKTRITFKATVKSEGGKAPDHKFSVVVDSPLINKYSQIYEDVIEVNDQDVKDEATLRKYGEQYFRTTLCDMLEDNLEIQVEGKSDVPVQIFDVVGLFHDRFKMDVRKKITKYTYSPMAKKLLSIGFGQFKSGLSNMVSNAVSDAVKNETQHLQGQFATQLAKEIKNADLDFDRKKEELVNQFTDGLNAAKAKAEEVKRELSDTIDQRFSSFNNGPLQEAKRRAEEALRNAGASTLLAQEAKRIGLDSIAKLEAFKSQAASAQTALSGDLDVLKRTIANDIRPKQAQVETEIAKQVRELIQTKNELSGIKSAQATYEDTTTRRLAELTNLANGKASKSEVVQTADELKSRIASVQASGRNLFLNSLFKQDILKTGISMTSTYTATIDSESKYLGHNALKIVGQDPAGKDGGNPKITYPALGQYGKVAPGSMTNQDVIISFYAKAEKAGTILRSRLGYIWFKDGNVTLTTEVKRYVVKFSRAWTGLSNLTTNEWLFNLNRADTVWIWMPKFEVNEADTPYSEAPEDIENQISAVESTFKQRVDSLDAGVNRLTEGLRTKADISALNVTAENIRQSVKSLETDTQNKLNQKLSTAEFEVRASGIRQEILNATKDKADKTLVTAEAGKLREEFSNLRIGGRNLIRNYDWNGLLPLNIISSGWKFERVEDQFAKSGYMLKATCTKAGNGGFHKGFFDLRPDEFQGKDMTWSWDMKSSRPITFYDMGFEAGGLKRNVPVSTEWTRITNTFRVAFNRFYSCVFYANGWQVGDVVYIRDPQLEEGTIATSPKPAPEDTDGLITETKATFERTAQGLRTDLSAIQTYVNKDSQRQDELRKYSREESARQATAVRELVTRDYVGKSTFQESIQGVERRLESYSLGISGNLLKNSNDGFRNQHAKRYRLVETLQANQTYTLVTKYWHGEKSTGHTFSDGIGNWRHLTYNRAIDAWMVQFTPKENIPQGTELTLSSHPSDGLGNMAWATLVRGHIPLAYWQPAKGDVEEGVTQKLAEYKETIDGRFANIVSQIANKANQTDFQRVRETSQLYERIIGSNENDISNKVARMALTNQLFQVEVSKVAKGGRNYIRNGQFKNGSKNWLEYQSVDFGLNFNYQHSQNPNNRNRPGLHFYHESQDVANFFGIQQSFAFDGVRGEKVTVSLLVSKDGGDGNSGLKVALHYIKNKNIIGQEWQSIPSPQITSKYKRFTFTFTLSDDVENLNLMLYGEKGKTINLYVTDVQLERGSVATDYKEALEDTDEAIRSVQNQLAGSWAVQNLTSAGSIVSQINATNNQILIEAEKIRLKGKTLLDELTAINGYFKRLFVGEGAFATLNTDVLRANSITADKLVMDMAMARMFVSSDIFTDTLAAKEAFINKLRSVVVTATLLEGYKGRIGGFQIGTHEKDSSVYWITGQNQFSVGMSNGSGQWSQTALWVNWGNNWGYPGDYAWYVKNNGKMYCYNTAEFWNTPVIHGNLRVTGHIYYNNENSGKSGYWIHSSKYSNFEPSNNYLYLYYSGSGYDWIPMNKEISDRRYKHNIEASTVSGLDVIESLKTYSYRKEYDGRIEDISCGIMAQDVQEFAPEAFFENPDGAYSYNTFALVPYLIKAIQELNQKIEKLEKTA